MSAAPDSSSGRHALLRFLQRERRITAADVTRLDDLAKQSGTSISTILEREDIIAEKDLAVLLATSLRLRLIDLSSYPLDAQLAQHLRESVAVRYDVVPVRIVDRTIEIATANPLDIDALKAVEFATGKRVQAVVATPLEIRDALAHVYRLQESLEQFLQHVPGDESLTLNELQDEGGDLRAIARDAELPPVIKLADLILIEGIKSRGSDVHIEPGIDSVAVRYRVDGVLEESFRFPKWVQNPLIARLKVMAKLDITERRVPQDGRIQLRYDNRVVDLRVSSLPAQHGEKITLRILDAVQAVTALTRIGLSRLDIEALRDAGKRPQGMVLVTGPTGSGKTTTLYALLREIFSPNINIVTIENPIEYQLKGINQVEVNEKQGLTFAGVLRSVLRQDPDVILVGEIRDKETAKIAAQAAQTGHLVLSTLHTNDVAGAITRLGDLGLEPYALASGLNVIMAQRLVRRVCQACSVPYQPSEDEVRRLGLPPDITGLRKGTGCAACRQSGYAGRTGVYEMIPVSAAVAKLIESGAGESAIRQRARLEGCRSMRDDAIEKLAAGVTTPEEILRVVQVVEGVAQCPGCRREVAEDYAACPHCGYGLRTICAGCAKPLSPEWTTCPYCGVAVPSADARAGADAADTGPTHERRTFKALVVDDTDAIREIVRLTLERSALGLTVTPCANGAEALAAAARERPDVVVLDISMPDMDGFEVCERLRSDVRTAFVPILMLTAHGTEEFVERGFGVGADDYMVKPVRRETLVARVRRMLERTYGAEALPSGPSATAAAGDEEPAPHAALAGAAASTPAATSAIATSPVAATESLADVVAWLAHERDDLAERVRACEARIADLTARLEASGSDAPRTPRSGSEDGLHEVRATLARVQNEQTRLAAALAQLTSDAERQDKDARQHPRAKTASA